MGEAIEMIKGTQSDVVAKDPSMNDMLESIRRMQIKGTQSEVCGDEVMKNKASTSGVKSTLSEVMKYEDDLSMDEVMRSVSRMQIKGTQSEICEDECGDITSGMSNLGLGGTQTREDIKRVSVN